MNRNELIASIPNTANDAFLYSNLIDKSIRCELKGIPTSSPFLTPEQQSVFIHSIAPGLSCDYVLDGGYADAERKVCIFRPDKEYGLSNDLPFVPIRVSYSKNASLNHRDILGSLMSLGIKRECIGDILISTESTDFFVLNDTADYILINYNRAGRTNLSCEKIDPASLHLPQQQYKEIRDTVASLRLDSILSSAFSLSRSKSAGLIQGGLAAVNGQVITKGSYEPRENDIISCKGYGKCRYIESPGYSKKGRYIIRIKKYI